MVRWRFLCLLGLSFATLGVAWRVPVGAQERFRPGPPPADQPGPRDADVLLFHVPEVGVASLRATFERAGVPTLARLKDGRLIAAHQHFPEDDPENWDKVAIRFSRDEGLHWSPLKVAQVAGMPSELRYPFDPTLVPLPDGRVRMYFTTVKLRSPRMYPTIHSAISEDGVSYQYEPGVRFGIEGRSVIDCAVVLHRGVFHLFSPDNGTDPTPGRSNVPPGGAYHATSTDGLTFTRKPDLRGSQRQRWLGGAVSDGERITFIGTADPVFPNSSGVWLGTSKNGENWTMQSSPVLRGADPGAVQAKDGGWLVLVTGSPRPGTPSARRMGRPAN